MQTMQQQRLDNATTTTQQNAM